MGHLENLKYLKKDMAIKGWSICNFIFNYKEFEYIVLVKRFVGTEKRINKYALVKLHFMKADNIKDDLQVEANSQGLLLEPKKLREYFGIEYINNLRNVLIQFYKRLGKAIPTVMPDLKQVTELEKQAMVYSLNKSDSEDPRKIYCIGVKRNPAGQTRSNFNSDKTKILRENLYNNFSNDLSISFCYSTDVNKEKDDSTIYRNFANN